MLTFSKLAMFSELEFDEELSLVMVAFACIFEMRIQWWKTEMSETVASKRTHWPEQTRNNAERGKYIEKEIERGIPAWWRFTRNSLRRSVYISFGRTTRDVENRELARRMHLYCTC